MRFPALVTLGLFLATASTARADLVQPSPADGNWWASSQLNGTAAAVTGVLAGAVLAASAAYRVVLEVEKLPDSPRDLKKIDLVPKIADRYLDAADRRPPMPSHSPAAVAFNEKATTVAIAVTLPLVLAGIAYGAAQLARKK